MKNLAIKALITVVTAGTLLTLSACGGSGGGNPSAASQTGIFELQLRWPNKSRLIPVASQSVVAILRDANGKILGNQTLTPPTDGSTLTTADFLNIPVGTVTLTAAAYPTSTGTGVPQAVGAASGTVTNGQKTTINVTMADTIVRIVITPANPTMEVNSTQQLTETCYDASNEVVLTSPSTIVWGTSTSDSFPISTTGVVSYDGIGSATITVTETESGVSGTTTVTGTTNTGDLNGGIQ